MSDTRHRLFGLFLLVLGGLVLFAPLAVQAKKGDTFHFSFFF